MIDPVDTIYTANMTAQQRAWFYAEYEHARKDEAAGVLFALFLGSFGIHHFYLRRNGLGVLYLLLFWTGIPALLGVLECFFMTGRVRRYNAQEASFLSSQISGSTGRAAAAVICPACAGSNDAAAIYCVHCGAALAAGPSSTGSSVGPMDTQQIA